MLLVVAAALVDSEGRVLVQRRPEGKAMAGLWEFPGGKIETGETPEFALVRELHEELGIVVEEQHLQRACFASEPLDQSHLLMLVYICRKWQGAVVASEAAAAQWLHPGSLRNLPMPPADGPLINLLERLI